MEQWRDSDRGADDRRCWPCALANSVIGLVIAWVPFAVMLLASNRSAVPVATAWGVAVTAYTVYRLVGHGTLPLAERIARETGLHDRLGPETEASGTERGDRQETGRRGDTESE